MALRQFYRFRLNSLHKLAVRSMSGEPGSGKGKGGGEGGAIRDAGGAFGKREAAQEEEYFRRVEREKLKAMKENVEEEVEFHEKQIKAHQKALERHKKLLKDMDKD